MGRSQKPRTGRHSVTSDSFDSPSRSTARAVGSEIQILSENKRTDMHPNTEGILESSLYVTDVARPARFYEKLFGFRVISDFGERGCAMKAGNRQVLLLFKKGGSRAGPTPHDGDGELHIAFDSNRVAGKLGSVAGGKWNRGGREARL